MRLICALTYYVLGLHVAETVLETLTFSKLVTKMSSCEKYLKLFICNFSDDPTEEDSRPSSRDLVVIACVQIALAAATLLSAAVCARIDCGT